MSANTERLERMACERAELAATMDSWTVPACMTAQAKLVAEQERLVAEAAFLRSLKLLVEAGERAQAGGLTFAELQDANERRAPEWRGGEDGPPVPLSFTALELCGEAGEFANAVKKLERTALGLKGGTTDQSHAVSELADVVICASLMAIRMGVDLGEAVRAKFNETSAKQGFHTTLPPEPKGGA